jgi:hypothetical protein
MSIVNLSHKPPARLEKLLVKPKTSFENNSPSR